MDRITIRKPEGRVGEMYVTVNRGRVYIDFCETRGQHMGGRWTWSGGWHEVEPYAIDETYAFEVSKPGLWDRIKSWFV